MTTSSDDEGVKRAGAGRCVECGAPASGKRELCLECRFMPSPWAAAVAVMGMLTLGVLLGSATSQVAQSAGLTSILLEAPAAAPAPEPASSAGTAAAAPEPAPLPATASSFPAPIPLAEEPVAEEAPAPPALPPEIPEEETLPPVKHVFLIVLEAGGFDERFGAGSTAPYLAQTLTAKGELIPNYFAVTASDLANQIALLSGQGPTPETAAECPSYADVAPGTLSAEGQVEGSGCIYPATTPTLPAQLAEKKLRAKAYVEGIAEPCVHEEGRRNPFVYFHSLLEDPECTKDDVGLDQLALDLRNAKKTPALSYVVPNACHEGGAVPCDPNSPSGPAATDEFLQRVVPAIEASPAFKEGGLIAITSSQALPTAPEPDTSSCCVAPEYPNLPAPATAETTVGPVKPTGGGGKVGLLLISPFVEPGSVEEAGYFNHYSLLLTIEELFGLEKLGYANEPALVPFGETVFNAADGEEAPVRQRRGPERNRLRHR